MSTIVTMPWLSISKWIQSLSTLRPPTDNFGTVAPSQARRGITGHKEHGLIMIKRYLKRSSKKIWNGCFNYDFTIHLYWSFLENNKNGLAFFDGKNQTKFNLDDKS